MEGQVTDQKHKKRMIELADRMGDILTDNDIVATLDTVNNVSVHFRFSDQYDGGAVEKAIRSVYEQMDQAEAVFVWRGPMAGDALGIGAVFDEDDARYVGFGGKKS